MLNSLEIRNYRNLKHLRIEKLGRVNLVIGKNNTGKTSLLEAVSLQVAYNQLEFFRWILQILMIRGEDFGERREIDKVIDIFSSLFYERKHIFYKDENSIQIGEINSPDKISITLVKAFPINESEVKVATSDFDIQGRQFNIEIFARRGNDEFMAMPVTNNQGIFRRKSDKELSKTSFGFIRSSTFDAAENSQHWSNIALTRKEEVVNNTLKLVEKNIERVAYISQSLEKPIVKLRGVDKPILLSSMGDGVNRILTIILSIVNCEDGYLLIDEFENGLHYSVQEKLWEIIFELSEQLNIQVFATTHSNDAIRTFENVVNRNSENPANGLLIKLDNIEGNIEATVFEPDELKFITDNFIEAR